MQLDQMIQKKTSPGEMAAKLGVDKQDLIYRSNLLKVQTNILTWSTLELELLEKSRNLEEFLEGYTNLFGKHRDKNIVINHWMNRDRYLAQWYKEKEGSGVHNVQI